MRSSADSEYIIVDDATMPIDPSSIASASAMSDVVVVVVSSSSSSVIPPRRRMAILRPSVRGRIGTTTMAWWSMMLSSFRDARGEAPGMIGGREKEWDGETWDVDAMTSINAYVDAQRCQVVAMATMV